MASEPTIDRAKKRLALWWAVRNVTGMVNTFFGYSQKDFVSSVVRSILHEGGTLILRNAYYAHREIFDLAIDFSGSRLKLWERDGDEYASISNRPASLENKMLQCGEPKW